MYVLLHRASDNMWKITTGMFMLIGIIAFADRRVNSSCPLELSPPSVVVRYGESVSANCTTSETEHDGMGWESKSGKNEPVYDVTSVVWDVANLQEWDARPICYINPIDGEQCHETLPVVVYKEPDSVSISHSSHTGPMVEGTAYQLQCDIINVAPVRNLTVIWYKEHKTIIHMQSYDSLTSVTPVNESSTLTITPGRDDNGAQVYCQAQINIGPSGPNPFPSQPHIMTVYYPPTFLSFQTETVDQADDITLDCTATGNPIPTYRWQCSNANQEKIGDHSVITTKMFPGICNCTASNDVGIETKQFIINLPKGSHPGAGTTAGIVMAVFVAVLVSGFAVYYIRNRRNNII